MKRTYGSITNYVARERLHWPLVIDPATGCYNQTPFADPRDFRILRNDWPYGMRPEIVHLVVWIKNYIPVKPHTGEITPESGMMIEKFVKEKFVKRLEEAGFPDAHDRVLWFKNWIALQSVRSLEHVHVLVRDVPDEIIVEWTGDAAPVQEDPLEASGVRSPN